VVELKQDLLEKAGATPQCRRVAVPTDLTGDWDTDLAATEFRAEHPTVWVVEGPLGYLDAAAVDAVLDRITGLSASDSHLLLDVIGQSLLDRPWIRPWLDRLADQDLAWTFGTDEPEELLALRGWKPEVVQYATAASRYGRWCYPGFPPFHGSVCVMLSRALAACSLATRRAM
jgi:methyltransferase (TIGR00027 family)